MKMIYSKINIIPLSILGAGTLLCGCGTVGPNYHAPATPTPAAWSSSMNGGEKASSDRLASWWKNFNDSELDSLVERAASGNLDLKIAAARVKEARALHGISESAFGPRLSTTESYQRLSSIDAIPLGKNAYISAFDASWEIDVFGGHRREVEASTARVAAAELDEQDAKIILSAEVARNYVDLRAYQRRLEIAKQNVKAQEDSQKITQQRFENGLTNNLDVQQSTALLEATRAEIPTLEAAVQLSIHCLGVLLGQQPGALVAELSTTSPIPVNPPEVPVALPSELLLRRPDVHMAERQLAAATADIGVATSDLFPKFSLTGLAGSLGDSANNWYASGSRFWSFGPVVQWNIFNSGRVQANIKLKKAQKEEVLAMYDKTVLGAFEDVENAMVAYAKEQERRESLEKAEKATQETLRLANQLYINGLANYINVLDAQRSLCQIQDQLVQSQQAVTVDLIALYKALGGGWEMGSRSVDTPLSIKN